MLSNIQVLRAFAAMNVVLYHVINTSISYGKPVETFLIFQGWGANGVDIFFVISGFVMSYTQSKSRKSAYEFMKNRVYRIAPIYWIVTIFVAMASLIIPSLFREMSFDLHRFIASLLFVSRVSGLGDPVLYVGWTLEYEMIFYFVFSLSILFSKYIDSRIFTIIGISSIYAAGMFHSIVFEFCFGILCAQVFMWRRVDSLGIVSLIFGVLLLFLSVGYQDIDNRLWLWGVPSVFIVLGCVNMRQTENRFLIYLGAASYSIYLCQAVSIPAFYKLLSATGIFIPADLVGVLAFLSTVATGCVFYQFVEKPISNRLKRA